MKLSIVIPALNEARTLPKVLEAVAASPYDKILERELKEFDR